MSGTVTALQVAVTAVFVILGLGSLVVYARQRTSASAWFAATFTVMGAVVVTGRILGDGELPDLGGRLLIVAILLFPYLLFRFAATFRERPRRGLDVLAATLTLVVVVWTMLLPDLPDAGEQQPAGYGAFVLAVVVQWVVLSALVATQLWRASRRHAGIARRRMVVVGTGAVLLSVALVLSAAVGGDESETAAIVVQAVALASALALALGFVPPPAVRAWWRQDVEASLHRAAVGLLAATNEQDVTRILLPHGAELIGAPRLALVSGGRLVDHIGQETVHPPDLEIPLQLGTLQVWMSRYAPFFGRDEQQLMERLGLLADLALDRIRLLGEERRARAELEQANADLESFVYSASHDLKGPLIAILGYIDVLTSEHTDPLTEEQSWFLARMRSNGHYMDALMRDLLELSRVGRVEVEESDVSLVEIATEVAEEVRIRYPEAIVEVGELPTVRLNPTRCRQLLSNLIGNAAAHTDHPDVRIRVEGRAHDDEYLVTVCDDGPGIPSEHRERVFGVFERLAARDGEGTSTGIGLAICRKIVQHAGGRIEFGDVAEGTEVRVFLPLRVLRDQEGQKREVAR